MPGIKKDGKSALTIRLDSFTMEKKIGTGVIVMSETNGKEISGIRSGIFEKVGGFLWQELQKFSFFDGNNERMAYYRLEHSYRVANVGAAIARPLR